MCQSVLGKLLWSVLNEQFPSAICKTLQTLVIEWLTRFWDTGLSITSLSAPFPILVLPGNSLLSSYSTGGSYLIPLERLEQVARIRKLLAVFNSCSTGIRFIAFNEYGVPIMLWSIIWWPYFFFLRLRYFAEP